VRTVAASSRVATHDRAATIETTMYRRRLVQLALELMSETPAVRMMLALLYAFFTSAHAMGNRFAAGPGPMRTRAATGAPGICN
jgi:hypothetical protein